MKKKLLTFGWLVVVLLLVDICIAAPSAKIIVISPDKNYNYIVNEEYAKSAPEPIRAILAYYSLKGGVSCWWEGDEPNKEWKNIDCGLTKALGLGYQCGGKQLDFVNRWFKDQKGKFTEQNCDSSLETATYGSNLPFLELELNRDIVSVRYNISHRVIREGEFWSQWGRDTFRVYPDKVVILQKMLFKERHYFSELGR